MSDLSPNNPTFSFDTDGAKAVFTYGDITIQVNFPTSEGLSDVAREEQLRKAAPQLRRALTVALEDLG